MTPVIETKKLTKYYGKSRGIIDLDLSIREGDIYGFIGPNGAGKSTTIRSLLGLIKPTSGNGTVLGYDCVKEKTRILERIGYMPSEAMFYSGMRVGEVIAFSASLHRQDCKQEAQRLCERFALDKKKKIEELSLGNRKKVSIICAMQHKPDLYILDEPTSGLDPLMQHEFFELIHERNKEGATIFLSSHVLSEIARHCNNAAIIKDGRLVTANAVEELTRTSARKVVLQGVDQVPEISGIKDGETGKGMVSFLYRGKMQELIRGLQGMEISDMTISEPDLEEIFMHYYGGEEK